MKYKNKDIVVLDDDSIKLYQKEILKIAEDVVRMFDRQNIDYALCGGSILGAVRHQGFIPWDDDIDINVPRASYNKLLKVFDTELGDRYYLQTPQNDPELGIMVTQIREKNTIARRKYDWNQDRCGVSIDVYIVENVFNNVFARFVQQTMSMACTFAISAIRFVKNRSLPKEIQELEGREYNYSGLKMIMGKILNVASMSSWIRWCNFWNSWCKDDTSRMVSVPTGRKHFSGEICNRRDICRYQKANFESTQFNIPVGSISYLERLYGDYMRLPPKDKRERHVFLELRF